MLASILIVALIGRVFGLLCLKSRGRFFSQLKCIFIKHLANLIVTLKLFYLALVRQLLSQDHGIIEVRRDLYSNLLQAVLVLRQGSSRH